MHTCTVLKFIIKKALGRFIHEPDLSQLEVELTKGCFMLSNVMINVKGINEHLKDVPFVLKSGYIEEIKIHIPYNILSEDLSIHVSGVELNFKVRGTLFFYVVVCALIVMIVDINLFLC